MRLTPRPVFLAGREDLLGELDAHLTADDGSSPRLVALCGLGGAGKTSVAVEYAHRHLAELGVVWQFAAEEPAALAAGFGDLARELGVRDLLEAGDPVAAVHGALAARPEGWLLVFDNVTGQAAIRDVLPPAGDGRVIITSRNALWPPDLILDVPVLDVKTAAGFLVSRTGQAGEENAARELAVELGGLPLALEQAAAYMQASGRSIGEYLKVFRQRSPDLMGRGEVAGYGNQQVTTTWALAFDQIQRNAPGAAGLLRLLACCAPDAVPLRLLLQPRPALSGAFGPEVAPLLEPLLADPLAVDDAVTVLRRFSLISAPQDGAVSVHRLVQAVTVASLPEQTAGGWRQGAAALIEAALPADPQLPATWPVFAALVPHAQAALTVHSGGMGQLASYLGYSGNHTAACDLFRQILADRAQALGPEHPDTLTARAELAHWTGEGWDAAGARDQLAALLPVRERVSGADHPDTLLVRSNLAYWTGAAGDAAGARNQCAALLPVIERVLGAEHPDTLTLRVSLAYWTGAAGDAAGARDQCAALLPVRERVSGADHPDTLLVRSNLAFLTGGAGDAAGARDQYAALLPVYERMLGAEHPETLDIRTSLAYWTGVAGDVVGARDQFAALPPVYERALGAEHPATLAARARIADWTGLAGDAAGARDQYAALLPVRERVFGAEHPDTLTYRVNFAAWAGAAGDAAGARDQFAALLPVYERVFGAEHPDTLLTRANLARWTGAAGDAAGARDQFATLVLVKERMSGTDHRDTLTTRAELAYWTGEAGDAAGARDQFATLLPVYERMSGAEHPDTLLARASLAHWTSQARDHQS